MKKSCRSWCLYLLVITLIAYYPAIRGGFIWDDDQYVTKNHTLRNLEGLAKIWTDIRATPQYYPLVHTSFWIEYHLWRLNPLGYHLINVLLHALNGMLLFLLLIRLKIPGAWFAAAVFCLHPVQVESVAWITERKNVLSGAFYFSAFLAYLGFVGRRGSGSPDGISPRPRTRAWCLYALSLALFGAALLGKTVTATLPLAVLIAMWWRGGRIERGGTVSLIPMTVVGGGMGLLTAWLEKYHVGAGGMAWRFSLAEKFLIAGRALWFYLGKLIWPAELVFNYPRWDVNERVWWQYLFPVGIAALGAILWFSRRAVGRGPLASLLYFILTLFPALGFFSVFPMRYSFVADHFQYLAIVGPIALFSGVAVNRLCPRPGAHDSPPSGKTGKSPFLLLGAGWLILLTLGFMTWKQCAIYKDEMTLWQDTLKKYPDSWIAHNNLGNLLSDRGQVNDAIAHFRQVKRLNPYQPEADNNIGTILFDRGELDMAIRYFRESLRIDPSYVIARKNLGITLAKQGKFKEAIAHYYEAIRLGPEYATTYNDLGAALAQVGEAAKAISYYREAIRINPEFSLAYYNLANALFRQGLFAEALGQYRQVVRLSPDFAEGYDDLGASLLKLGRAGEAMEYFAKAVRLKPQLASAHYNLGFTLEMSGRTQEALREYGLAVGIDPGLVDAGKRRESILSGH